MQPKKPGASGPPYRGYRYALIELLRCLADPRVGPQWRTVESIGLKPLRRANKSSLGDHASVRLRILYMKTKLTKIGGDLSRRWNLPRGPTLRAQTTNTSVTTTKGAFTEYVPGSQR